MNEAQYVLPDQLEPIAGESLTGLMMRYAAIYPFDEPERLFDQLERRRRTASAWACLDPSSGDAGAMRRLLHLDEACLRRMSNWHATPHRISVAGHRVEEGLADLRMRQVCPDCLKVSGHHRETWLVTAIPVCPVHRTRLLARCPDCDAPLGWRGPGVAFCGNEDCAADLREFRAERATRHEARAAEGLLALLDGGRHPSGLGFGEALRATLVLGSMRVRGIRSGVLSADMRKIRDQLPAMLSGGWSALHGWPNGFRRFLVEQRARADDGSSTSLSRPFGDLARYLRRPRELAWSAPLLTELTAWAATQPSLTVRPDALRRRGLDRDREWLTLNEAARFFGISAEAMSRAATRLSLHADGERSATQFRLDAARLRRLASALKAHGELLSRDEAAAMLAITVRTVDVLIDRGLLVLIPEEDRLMARRHIRRTDVQAILSAFRWASPIEELGSGLIDRARR